MNNTLLYLALGFFACGIGMQILFALIGGSVTQDGTLKEPFFLVPMGYLFCFIGFAFGLFAYMRS